MVKKSFFERSLKLKRGYKVPVEVRVNGMRTVVHKYVNAYTKSRAEKQAKGLILHDIRITIGKTTRVKGK